MKLTHDRPAGGQELGDRARSLADAADRIGGRNEPWQDRLDRLRSLALIRGRLQAERIDRRLARKRLPRSAGSGELRAVGVIKRRRRRRDAPLLKLPAKRLRKRDKRVETAKAPSDAGSPNDAFRLRRRPDAGALKKRRVGWRRLGNVVGERIGVRASGRRRLRRVVSKGSAELLAIRTRSPPGQSLSACRER